MHVTKLGTEQKKKRNLLHIHTKLSRNFNFMKNNKVDESKIYETYIYIKKTISALSTGYFTFKGVWCSESVQKYCLSAQLMCPHWLKCLLLCLWGMSRHQLLVRQLLLARCLLPPHLRCIQTRHCHSHKSSKSHLQSQSKPLHRGRYSDLVLETGTGLLREQIQTIYCAEIKIWRKSLINGMNGLARVLTHPCPTI